jgi:hypothetical protein
MAAVHAVSHWRKLGVSHLRRHRRIIAILTLTPSVNCFNVRPGRPGILINIKHGAKPVAGCRKGSRRPVLRHEAGDPARAGQHFQEEQAGLEFVYSGVGNLKDNGNATFFN